jgi:TonB-dependent receptor
MGITTKQRLLSVLIASSLSAFGLAHAADDTDVDNLKHAKTLSSVDVKGKQLPDAGTVDEQRLSTSVSTVMSKAEIDAIPSANITDVVSHMPGLSAYSDMHLGQAATGENEYVTIRGLDSSYNAYTVNGSPLPETDASTRAISLNMLAPFGIQSIKVSKAPTPDMAGDSIGGAIDMRTPTAFDFEKDTYARTTVQGKLNDLASKRNQPDSGGTIEQEYAQRFGASKNWGIYAAGYWGKNSTVAEATSPNDNYTPVNSAFAGAKDLRNVGALQNDSYKWDFYTDQIKRYGANVSLDWRGENTSLYARAIYSVYKVKGEDNQVSATNFPDSDPANDVVLRGGYFNTRDITEKMGSLQLGGITSMDPLTLDYGTSFGTGTRNRPDYVEASLYGPFAPGQANFDISRPASPSVEGSSASVKNYLYDLSSDGFWKTQGHDAGSKAKRVNLHANALYALDRGLLDSIKFGVSADTSRRDAYDHPFFHDDNNFVYGGTYFGGPNYDALTPGGPLLSALPGSIVTGAFDGFKGVTKVINRDWVLAQAVPYKYVNDPNGVGNYTQNDYNANTTGSRENIYAGYFMANFKAGDVVVTPGFRYELTDYSASSWVSSGDDATGHFAGTGRHYGELLPGINLAWRPDPLTVYRASLRRSFSRPAFGLLSGETTYSVNDVTGQIIGISQPNPNLQPTTADNLDLSAEFYDADGGLATVSTYYKRLNKFIYTSQAGTTNDSSLGGNVPTGVTVANGVAVSMPENGGKAMLYGMELAARKQFLWLPGIWNHLGLGANITLQHSQADSLRPDHEGRDTWLPRAPQRMYNLDLFYESQRLHADLTYNYTGLQLVTLSSNGLDVYLQPVKMLDATVKYDVSPNVTVGVAVKNLLNHATFWETQGKSNTYLAYDAGGNGSYVQTGRLYMLTLSYSL